MFKTSRFVLQQQKEAVLPPRKKLRGIISPYSSSLHGPLRAPVARTLPVMPYEFWLTCRNSVAPFRESALVVSSDEEKGDADVFFQQAKEHFQNVLDFRFPRKLFIENKKQDLQQINASLQEKSLKIFEQQQKLELQQLYVQQQEDQAHSLVAEYCKSSGKSGVDLVVFSPVCTSSLVNPSSSAAARSASTPSSSSEKPKLISNPQDLHFAFQTFQSLLRPHGALCLTGTDFLSSSELLIGEEKSKMKNSTSQDWKDFCRFLESKSSAEELFLTQIEQLKLVDEFAKESGGFVNTMFYEFETEYPLDANFKILSGLIRRVPAYRRQIEVVATVEESHYNDDDDDDQLGKGKEQEQNNKNNNLNDPKEVFAHRLAKSREEGQQRQNSDVSDPLECFIELAKLRNGNLQTNHARLKLKHWMWVCDRRPRSKDSISFLSRGGK